MSQPVKLSDELIVDARVAGKVWTRSIAGQVEFWAQLGRALEPLLNGVQAMSILQRGAARPLIDLLQEVDTPEGQQRLQRHLEQRPFPHYAAHPNRPGLLIRTGEDGQQVIGRFIKRQFTAVGDE